MNRTTKASRLLFICYSLILVWIVLLKTALSLDDLLALHSPRQVQLIPFSSGDGRIHTMETVLNVLVFIPMGLYLRQFSLSGIRAVLTGLGCSLAFELCQFLLAIGAADVTDLMSNTAGTAAGVFLYALLQWFFSDRQKTHRFINTAATLALLLFGILSLLLAAANRF